MTVGQKEESNDKYKLKLPKGFKFENGKTFIPRPPNAQELEMLAQYHAEMQHSTTEEEFVDCANFAMSSYIAVYDHYITGGPGFAGKLMVVLYDGSPGNVQVFSFQGNKLKVQAEMND